MRQDIIDRLGADPDHVRVIAAVPGPNQSTLHFTLFGGNLAIVQEWPEEFEVYVSTPNSIAETRRALGLE